MLRKLGWVGFGAALGMLSLGCMAPEPESDDGDEDIGFVQQAAKGGQDKITVCHHPTTDHATIEVSAPAVAAHLGHGDTLGACDSGGGSGGASGGSGGAAGGGADPGGGGTGGSVGGGGTAGGDPGGGGTGGNTCLANSDACEVDAECCSGTCSGFICVQTPPPPCNLTGELCSSDSECCDGSSCFDGACVNSDPNACTPLDTLCDPQTGNGCCGPANPCCDGLHCTFGGFCWTNADVSTCLNPGTPCAGNETPCCWADFCPADGICP